MTQTAQRRAIAAYRHRLAARGISRFEVRSLDRDKPLLRRLAARLAADDAEAERLRAELARDVAAPEPARGGILAALRRSPLVGAGLDLRREPTAGRDIVV
ncbi:MAG: hypothetical protein HIU82_18790 [Proteobacteria bacterium]|nr:hypothetical protein [Pseudomonadota bacterium]